MKVKPTEILLTSHAVRRQSTQPFLIKGSHKMTIPPKLNADVELVCSLLLLPTSDQQQGMRLLVRQRERSSPRAAAPSVLEMQ